MYSLQTEYVNLHWLENILLWGTTEKSADFCGSKYKVLKFNNQFKIPGISPIVEMTEQQPAFSFWEVRMRNFTTFEMFEGELL